MEKFSRTKQSVIKIFKKGFALSFTIRWYPHRLVRRGFMAKKNGLDSLLSVRSAKTRNIHKEPGRKNTARSRILLLLRIFGGFTEKELYITPPLLGDYVIVKKIVVMCFHTSKVYFITAQCNVHRKSSFFKLKCIFIPS